MRLDMRNSASFNVLLR